ncbi:GNAT family N-acetyltransferase [Limnoglobus roseus]
MNGTNKPGDRIGWSFVAEKNGFLEVEELYVRPEWRKRGVGRDLVARLQELASVKKAQLRLWVPFADAFRDSRGTQDALLAISRRMGLRFTKTPVRWAAYLAEPNGTSDFPIEPDLYPELLFSIRRIRRRYFIARPPPALLHELFTHEWITSDRPNPPDPVPEQSRPPWSVLVGAALSSGDGVFALAATPSSSRSGPTAHSPRPTVARGEPKPTGRKRPVALSSSSPSRSASRSAILWRGRPSGAAMGRRSRLGQRVAVEGTPKPRGRGPSPRPLLLWEWVGEAAGEATLCRGRGLTPSSL